MIMTFSGVYESSIEPIRFTEGLLSFTLYINLQVILMTDFEHRMNDLELTAKSFCGESVNKVYKTLSKKHKANVFDYERAIDYIDRQMLIPAAKDDVLTKGSMKEAWRSKYPRALRMQVAEIIVDKMLVEFRLGNYWE